MLPQDSGRIMRSQEIRGQELTCDSNVVYLDSSPTSLKSLLFQDLKLDANQPWERSLLHSLRDISLVDRSVTKKHVDKLLLKHTESRDQAIAMDLADDETVMTSSSLGVTTHSPYNSIYRRPTRETSELNETLPNSDGGDGVKLIRGPFLADTLSSVTNPCCGETDDPEDCHEQQEEDRGGHEDELRDYGERSIQKRRASDCGSGRRSLRSRFARQRSAPILRASGSVIGENNDAPTFGGVDDDNTIYSNSILESERSMSSLGFMGYAYWGFCPFKGFLAQDGANEAITEHCSGMTDDLVNL